MAVWNDKDFLKEGGSVFSPFNPEQIQPASYDLTLGNSFAILPEHSNFFYDLKTRSYYSNMTGEIIAPWQNFILPEGEKFILAPNHFALGTTTEYVKIPADVIGRVEGKSSLGRIGLMVHVTAGYIDPGFHGQITMEFKNISPYPIYLSTGSPIGQISIHKLSEAPTKLYGECGNHYQNQIGATPPK